MSRVLEKNANIDPHYGIPNVNQYYLDLEEFQYNKMCMTEIVNADLAIATQGVETFYLGCNEVLKLVQQALEAMQLNQLIHLYAFNYRSFILVSNSDMPKSEFIRVMQFFYDQFEHTTADSTPLSGVSRFALVLQADHMIERALNTFLFNKDMQANFLVCKDELEDVSGLNINSSVVELLSKAVNNCHLVPYYQGIHNNETGCFDKYEALMRIVDENGVVHFPDCFLAVAKEYKFYNKLSRMMIQRVLDDFRNRTEEVSINISLYDIQTTEFRTWFIQELEAYNDPRRVLIEFVETENFVEDQVYFSFIQEIRSIGCQIAVDDFGAGYASYARLISLKPDYIKVDGSIIKHITKKEENLIIFRSICYLADLIGAKVVCEFVENEEIQSLICEYNAPFSQGYYFAKPKPITEIS